MFVLGIDPGLTRTGYGIVEATGGSAHAVAAGVIRTDPKVEESMRLLEIRHDLEDVLDEFPIAAAAIEEVFINRNRGTAMAVARASGVIMATIADRGLGVTEYSPSKMKMTVTGSGSADKAQIQAVLTMRLGVEAGGQTDALDALGIALCHVQHLGPAAVTAASPAAVTS